MAGFRLVLSGIFFLASLALSSPSARAQGDVILVDGLCFPPISTCNTMDPTQPPQDCPPGYRCACVSSSPEVDDCPVEVCIAGPGPECKTACDCEPGLGCFDGQCIAGFAPVFCCDADICPEGEQCQSRDGTFSRCNRDPMCLERAEKARLAVAEIVDTYNGCRRNDDCTGVNVDTECGRTCPAFVNRRAVKKVMEKIDEVDQAICSTYLEDGCPIAIPICRAELPACIENECVGLSFEVPIPLLD